MPVFLRTSGIAANLSSSAFRQKGVKDSRKPALTVEHRDRQAGTEHGYDQFGPAGEMRVSGFQVHQRQLFIWHGHDTFP
jgi:hypothetical protein